MASCVLTEGEEFRILNPLGSGGFGCVFLIWHRKFGKIAYKELQESDSGDKHLRKKLEDEATIQRSLKHPNIVALYGEKFDPDNCGLFLEYMENGPVNEFLENFSVTWGWKIQIMQDVSLAMNFLHSHQPAIVHGDLKCQNILIGTDYHAKITDFGLAQTILNIKNTDGSHCYGGTLEYIAPECLTSPRREKTVKFDVYSFAISMWEIFSQERAFNNNYCDRRTIPVLVLDGQRPEITNDIMSLCGN